MTDSLGLAYDLAFAKLALDPKTLASAVTKRMMRVMPEARHLIGPEARKIEEAAARQLDITLGVLPRSETKQYVRFMQEAFPKIRPKEPYAQRVMRLFGPKMQEWGIKMMSRMSPAQQAQYLREGAEVAQYAHRGRMRMMKARDPETYREVLKSMPAHLKATSKMHKEIGELMEGQEWKLPPKPASTPSGAIPRGVDPKKYLKDYRARIEAETKEILGPMSGESFGGGMP